MYVNNAPPASAKTLGDLRKDAAARFSVPLTNVRFLRPSGAELEDGMELLEAPAKCLVDITQVGGGEGGRAGGRRGRGAQRARLASVRAHAPPGGRTHTVRTRGVCARPPTHHRPPPHTHKPPARRTQSPPATRWS